MKYLLVITFILLNTLQLFSQEQKRVLVRNFKSATLDSIEITTITNYFIDEMRKNSAYRIISFDEAVTLADQNGLTVSQDCDDAKCLETITNAIDAPYYTKGEINEIGSRFIITVSLMSITETTAIEAVSERAASLNETVELMSTIASRILKTEKSYVVQFSISPLGGIIYVDDELMVQETIGFGELTLGNHTIKVVKENYQEWTETIAVTEDFQVVEAILVPAIKRQQAVVTTSQIETEPIPEVSQQNLAPNSTSSPIRSGGWGTSPYVPRVSGHNRGSVRNTQNQNTSRQSQYENRQEAKR